MYEQVWGTEEGREGGEQDRRRGWRVQRCHRTGGVEGLLVGQRLNSTKAEGERGKGGKRSVDPAFAVSGSHLFTHSTVPPRSQKEGNCTISHLKGTV